MVHTHTSEMSVNLDASNEYSVQSDDKGSFSALDDLIRNVWTKKMLEGAFRYNFDKPLTRHLQTEKV